MKGFFTDIFKKLISPKSDDSDVARKELILNILLGTTITFVSLILVIQIVIRIFDLLGDETLNRYGVSPWITTAVFGFFISLYILLRKGFVKLGSHLFIFAFFLPVSYDVYIQGNTFPASLLSYAFIIVMSGILIHSRFAFSMAALTAFVILVVGYFQYGIVFVNQYNNKESGVVNVIDTFVGGVILFLIAAVSWLSNREIEKSLARARRSEAELKKERDSLEATVEQRTRELKETQAEKMTQLYRFAEFGRLSSGLFHDLINPLTAVSLNIEKVKNAEEVRNHVKSIDPIRSRARASGVSPKNHGAATSNGVEEKTGAASISEVSEYVDKAIVAAKKIEDMVGAVRKQLSRQETKTLFSVNDEIAQALEVLAYKAQKSGVAIRLFSHKDLKTYGDAVKFNQVALNLIANAIDAYLEKTNIDSKPITMSLSEGGGMIVFEVKDNGVGISEENKPKLFEPFFTTKKEGYGLGIGLSMIKRIIETDFGGSVSVESKEGEGSVFTVKFPQKAQNG